MYRPTCLMYRHSRRTKVRLASCSGSWNQSAANSAAPDSLDKVTPGEKSPDERTALKPIILTRPKSAIRTNPVLLTRTFVYLTRRRDEKCVGDFGFAPLEIPVNHPRLAKAGHATHGLRGFKVIGDREIKFRGNRKRSH